MKNFLGWVYDTALTKYALKVRGSTGVERAVADEDGRTYQLGTAITATAAQLNGTSPALTTPAITGGVTTDGVDTWTQSPHDYAGAAVAWTLSAAELLKPMHKPTNANGAVDAVIPLTTKRPYWFTNGTGQALTVKGASGTGIVIANTKTACVMSDGTNIIRLTLDA